jgi:hypothetical protein
MPVLEVFCFSSFEPFLSVVFVFFCCVTFLPSSSGIFYVEGNLSHSTITNSTFTRITALYENTYGGVLLVSTPDYSTFTIHRCVFTQCSAYYGGALYFYSSTPYILITNTRFEDNSATLYGDDIYVNTSPCLLGFSGGEGSLDGTCSTTQGGDRVNCQYTTMEYLLNDCTTETVCGGKEEEERREKGVYIRRN